MNRRLVVPPRLFISFDFCKSMDFPLWDSDFHLSSPCISQSSSSLLPPLPPTPSHLSHLPPNLGLFFSVEWKRRFATVSVWISTHCLNGYPHIASTRVQYNTSALYFNPSTQPYNFIENFYKLKAFTNCVAICDYTKADNTLAAWQ